MKDVAYPHFEVKWQLVIMPLRKAWYLKQEF
jgi:hypothetical protein